MPIGFQHPELLLLAVPAAWVWWAMRSGHVLGLALRALALALLVVAAAGPYLARASTGRDLVVVVDRSRSMPEEARASALELIRLAEERRAQGDRVGVVSFGARAALERPLSEDAAFAGFERGVEPDGSDLALALETALELLPEERPGSILVLSDGEARGRDPLPAARRAFARGVRVDVRAWPRPAVQDVAVERLDLPGRVEAGAPFQLSAWVRAEAPTRASYELVRDGLVLARGEREFESGSNRLLFRDLVDQGGLATYRLRLLAAEDRVPENDEGLGAVLVSGAPALLLVNEGGSESALARALKAAGVPVEVVRPEEAPLDRAALEARRAVILEDVEAGRLVDGLADLREWVLERGGGLMLTGGRASFGVGGYFLSPIDDVLPVSMEMRDEQRVQGLALAIALDRSGSMSVQVEGGRTKMELADLGAAAALRLLSRIDAAALLAVDTSAHVVREMAPLADPAEAARAAMGVQAGGGGIYVRTALVEAVAQLARAQQQNRHVILFADANDAEEQEGCDELVAELAGLGATLSVIALGKDSDQHAGFLEDIAAAGGGACYFTERAEDLPRLFAQDTLTASRTTFVEERTEVQALPELFGVGELPATPVPALGGYNLTWLRDGAVLGLVTLDGFRAPAFAYSPRGLGRTAAFTGQVGGSFGAELAAWEDLDAFFATIARWLIGPQAPAAVYASARREGREAVVRVELDADAPDAPVGAELRARFAGEGAAPVERTMERVGLDVYEARFPLERPGIGLGSVLVGDALALRLPPVALPYSPEFEPSADPARGERLLRELARESGGALAPSADELFRGPREGRAWRPFARELLLVVLVLVLLEIAGRRLALFDALSSALRRRRSASEPEPALDLPPARKAEPLPKSEPAPAPPSARRPASTGSLTDALERARRSADRELR